MEIEEYKYLGILINKEISINCLIENNIIEKSDIKLVDKIKFQISEGNYEFNIFKRTDGIYIDFKQGEVKVKEKISSDFIIQNLDSETIKNVINNNVSWWDGTYTTKIEIVRDMEVNQLEVILKINDNNATLKFLSKNNASSINLIIKNLLGQGPMEFTINSKIFEENIVLSPHQCLHLGLQ